MDFGKIGTILATALSLYLISAACSLIQGFLMTGVSQKTTYKLRKNLTEDQPDADELFRYETGRRSSFKSDK